MSIFSKKKRKVAVQNSTEEIAIAFLQRTVVAINGQLREEISRNGFSLEEMKAGKVKLLRSVTTSERDARFTTEAFSVKRGEKGVERLIMAVKWSPTGFVIERNSATTANAIKSNPLFGVKKGQDPNIIRKVSEADVEMQVKASEYTRDYLKGLESMK